MNFLTPMVVKVTSLGLSLVLHIATSGITIINSFDKIRPEHAVSTKPDTVGKPS